MFKITTETLPDELKLGLEAIQECNPALFSPNGNELGFVHDNSLPSGAYQVGKNGGRYVIRYQRRIDAFRALGRLAGNLEVASAPKEFSESTQFTMLGAMFDLSRNGVMNIPTFRNILGHMALMGINSVGLYCEDTYEIPGEPFFGYLRGAYTYEELKALDDHADALGIELFPCIQTLGHLEQILQWEAYSKLADTPNVILAEHEPAYALIEKMIDAASKPFRSKRIHVGMDEAHGIGLGNYRKVVGEKSPFEILNSHLARVRKMCLDRGLRPMIWSDMYFRLGSKTNNYYDKEAVISKEVIERIPKDVDLVYWDYYHTESDFYEEWIERHRAMGSEPVVASGVWTWDRFWLAYRFTETTVSACMKACRNQQVREVFVTLWGDDGAECEIYSSLPGLQYFAELGYHGSIDEAAMHRHFRGVCGADFHNWILGGELDSLPVIPDPATTRPNVSKWLLWEDPILGHLTPELGGASLREHYSGLASRLRQASMEEGDCPALARAAQVAQVLSLKQGMREEIVAAYKKQDRQAIQKYADQEIPRLILEVERLWELHRQRWMRCNKPFGWEVIEHRYGGLVFRLKTFAERLSGWLGGRYPSIPELETELHVMSGNTKGLQHLPNVRHPRAKTPSKIG